MAEEQSTDETTEQPAADTHEATGAETVGAQDAEADGDPAAAQDETPTLESLTAELAAAQALAADAKDQVLRAQAETENVRRRAARDVENAHKFALEKFTKALIPVIESLDKAEAARGDLNAEEGAANADAVLEGVSLSLKLFKDTLEKQGVTELDPHGEPFNPEYHEAVAMVPMPTVEPNSVIEVVRKGYSLNGRLMQAAQVVVASAPADSG